MKTEISRDSHQPEKRYSGVYQQQGRMLTDADWNELVDIVKEQLRGALKDVVGDGSPRKSAVLDNDKDVQMRWGTVYVDGIQGSIRPVPGTENGFEYAMQQDFPDPPPLPETGIYYVDLWERAVTQLGDGNLRDKGLHGADTCTRTQVIAQVKVCPSDEDFEKKNPRKGDAPVTIKLRNASANHDPCDPCAGQVDVASRVGNYLFRLEVHDVVGDANEPNEITLKWSTENGAIQCGLLNGTEYQAPPAHFTAGSWVYEYFDETTERHLGVHLVQGWRPGRWRLMKEFIQPTDEMPKEAVRRWDGFCTLVRSGKTWTTSAACFDRVMKENFVSLKDTTKGTTLTLTLDAQEIVLVLAGHSFVAGDFWLAPVREAEHAAGTPLISEAPPAGIEHHYLRLGVRKAGGVEKNSETDRKYAFPSLTEMTRMFIAGGDGQEVTPSDQATVLPVPLRVAVANGEWPVKGAKVRFATTDGALDCANGIVETDDNGIAECRWTPGAIDKSQAPTWPKQFRLCATLVNPADEAKDLDHPPLHFRATLLSADQVAYVTRCPNEGDGQGNTVKQLLLGTGTGTGTHGYYLVKDVLDALLCDLTAGHIPYPEPQCAAAPSIKSLLLTLAPHTLQSAGDGSPRLTVQDILDTLLCALKADHIPYDSPNCQNSPSVKSLIGSLGSNASVKEALDTLLCRLTAEFLPYDPSKKGKRWEDINEGKDEGKDSPRTVQQAIDDIVENLDSEDVKYPLPECGGNSLFNRLRKEIHPDPENEKLTRTKEVLDALLCHLDASKLPYDPACDYLKTAKVQTVQDAIDALCTRPVDAAQCNAFLKLFGRGVLCGIIPEIPIAVNTVKEPLVNATIRTSAGTIIDGYGCIRNVPALDITGDLTGYRWVTAYMAKETPKPLRTKAATKAAATKSTLAAVASVRSTVPSDKLKQISDEVISQDIAAKYGTDTQGATAAIRAIIDSVLPVESQEIRDAVADMVIVYGYYMGEEHKYELYLVSPRDKDPYLEIREVEPPALTQVTKAHAAFAMEQGTTLTIDRLNPFHVAEATGACIESQNKAWSPFLAYQCPEENADGAVCLATIGVMEDSVWISPDAREQVISPAILTKVLYKPSSVYPAIGAACAGSTLADAG